MEYNGILHVILYLWLQLLLKTKRSDDRFGFLIFNSYHNIFRSYFTQYVFCCSLCNALQFAGRLNSPTGSASEVMTFCLQWPREPNCVTVMGCYLSRLYFVVDILCGLSAIYWLLLLTSWTIWFWLLDYSHCTQTATCWWVTSRMILCVRFRYGHRIPVTTQFMKLGWT